MESLSATPMELTHMYKSLVVLFATLFITHFAWCASYALQGLPARERPMLYGRLGVLGELIPKMFSVLAFLSMIGAVAWGVIHAA